MKGGQEGVKRQRWDAGEHPLMWRNQRGQGSGQGREAAAASGGHKGGKQEQNDPRVYAGICAPAGRRLRGAAFQPRSRRTFFPGLGSARLLGSRRLPGDLRLIPPDVPLAPTCGPGAAPGALRFLAPCRTKPSLL